MKTARIVAVAVLMIGVGLTLPVAWAQSPGVTHTDLQRHDLSAHGRAVIQARVELGEAARRGGQVILHPSPL